MFGKSVKDYALPLYCLHQNLIDIDIDIDTLFKVEIFLV